MPPPRHVVEHAEGEPALVVAGEAGAAEHQVGLLGVLVAHHDWPAGARAGAAGSAGAVRRRFGAASPATPDRANASVTSRDHRGVVEVAGGGDTMVGGDVPRR